MGVDYRSNFGIGFQVKAKEFDEDSEFCDMNEFLEDFCKGNNLEFFETGEAAYSSQEEASFFVTLKDPFKDGADLTGKKEVLFSALWQSKIETIGEFGLVGGLLVC